MNSQTLRKILLNSNRKNNEKMPNILKSISHSSNRNNKLMKSATLNNSSVNVSKISTNKRFLHLSISKNKYSDLKKDDYQNNNENFELLRDNLIKVKEDYNEKSKELYNLKLKYNKLIEYNRNNLKLLYNIMKRSGIIDNNGKNINNIDISQILSKEEQELLKRKHLISCFKTKLFEYKNLLDKKDTEITKIRKSARIHKLVKLENDNACISLENMNLSIEKNQLNNKISNMETIMDFLNNQCYRLKKNENKNMNNIGELTNKIQILENELLMKDKIIVNLTKKINKNKEENKTLENKIKNSESEMNKLEEDKKKCEIYLEEKNNYEKNFVNMKKKLEALKIENEKLKLNLNKSKDLNGELLTKYEGLIKEKDKNKLIIDEIKRKIKEKDKEIKTIDEKIQNNNLKKDVKKEKNQDNNNNENIDINEFNKYLNELELLKKKILKLEEKNNLFNKLM